MKFSEMPKPQLKALASKGGYATQYVWGTAHEFTREESSLGGKKIYERLKDSWRERSRKAGIASARKRRVKKLLKVIYE